MSEKTKKPIFTTKEIAMIGLFVAVCAVCAWASIPLPAPMAAFTLQTFAVFTAVGILGLRNGLITVIVYILLGAIGVPVFSKMTGGMGILLGTTGGYIIGFIFTALVIGLIIKKFGKKIPVLAIANVLGLLVCYIFGTAWFMIVYTRTKGPVSLLAALGWCVFPYLVGDAIKIIAAIAVVKAIEKTKLI